MRMMLLLAAALATMTMIPAPASAHGHGAIQSHALTSFGLSIVVHDTPNFVSHRHRPAWHLRPQPWPRRFFYHAPRPGRYHAPRPVWHKPWRPGPRHFHRSHGGHPRWAHGPGRPGHPRWAHGPGRSPHWGIRHDRPNGRDFRHGRDGRHR
jgi:hypothetical protein